MKYLGILLLAACLIMGCSNTLEPENLSETLPCDELLDGIDWSESSLPKIITTVYLLHVPVDWPQLKEIVTEDGAVNVMISPKKLEEILIAVKSDPKAKLLGRPQILTHDNQEGQVRTLEEDGSETFNMKIKHHVGLDEKIFWTEVVLLQSSMTEQCHVTTQTLTILPGHAFALGGIETAQDVNLLLIQPEFIEIKLPKSDKSNPCTGDPVSFAGVSLNK